MARKHEQLMADIKRIKEQATKNLGRHTFSIEDKNLVLCSTSDELYLTHEEGLQLRDFLNEMYAVVPDPMISYKIDETTPIGSLVYYKKGLVVKILSHIDTADFEGIVITGSITYGTGEIHYWNKNSANITKIEQPTKGEG